MRIYKTAKKLLIQLIAIVIFSLSSCYPDNFSAVSELDIVVTFYDEDADFTANKTYSLPDSVVVIDSLTGQDDTGKFDDAILEQIRENLEALGYVEETDPENNPPDVLVLASRSVNQRHGVAPIPPWWGWWGWYPWWGPFPPVGPGWGPWYPWWGGAVVVSFDIGTLVIEMFDVSEIDESEQRLPAIWLGGVNGLLDGSDAAINARITTSIDQAFDQSPYLKTN